MCDLRNQSPKEIVSRIVLPPGSWKTTANWTSLVACQVRSKRDSLRRIWGYLCAPAQRPAEVHGTRIRGRGEWVRELGGGAGGRSRRHLPHGDLEAERRSG